MKNKLLYYSGGGYDGCIWEWNFCFWNQDSKWHDLFSSGCNGADTEAKALAIVENMEKTGWLCKFEPTLVDLTDKEQYLQFQKDNNAGLVLQIAQELNKNYNYDIEVKCGECDHEFIVDESECDMAVNSDTIVCSECYRQGICDCCSEYVGGDMIRGCSDDSDDETEVDLNYSGFYSICSDCYEGRKEQIESDKQEDMLFASLTTGTPDMFSDEMRWYWNCPERDEILQIEKE